VTLEAHFDPSFTATLALREKQIQQSYRPIIGVHKWFARRPGTVFRSLLLAEFNDSEPVHTSYWRSHSLRGVIADPFMGGGTPIFEATRLGFSVVGTDVNPIAYWIVRQSLAPLDLNRFSSLAETVSSDIESEIGHLYRTQCTRCGQPAAVKYFLWVKTEQCPACGTSNDLFPGYLLAEATRHPKHVLLCGACGTLNEYDRQPTQSDPEPCGECRRPVRLEGPARRQRVLCRNCGTLYAYPPPRPTHPPTHRMWAIEYHCESCKPAHRGRFFKQPDEQDLARFQEAHHRLVQNPSLEIPEDAIPAGDETNRLHRWGYRRYREMFNARQLLGLGLLLKRIRMVDEDEQRHALLTIFSDFLRYQNMLCRYDTYALKCQDIFSVHGFPVGLVQCENNLIGIPRVGSGAFRHFVEKYLRAKRYCQAPFETRYVARRKELVPIGGERIQAQFVDTFPRPDGQQAYLRAASATQMHLPDASLDGVFTDPPYFANVQYAELVDFCFVWLRLALRDELPEFCATTTRSPAELTGNVTLGRGLLEFAQGLSAIFRHYAKALKPGGPFVFTYHHNDPSAYVPLVVAILDAGLDCSATLPAPAEMSASLHIAGTGSSILDSVFVCRAAVRLQRGKDIQSALIDDVTAMSQAGLHISEGDIRCLAAGHAARIAVNRLRPSWNTNAPLKERIAQAGGCLAHLSEELPVGPLMQRMLELDRVTA
jgi:adenine-specific DNA methylase